MHAAPDGFAKSGDGRRVAVIGQRSESRYLYTEKGEQAGFETRGGNVTLLVWELPTAGPGDKEDARPLAGTPEQIILWLQVQTGRDVGPPACSPEIVNMSEVSWRKAREKLAATGGLQIPG